MDLTVNVASPPLTAAVPNVVTWVFFPCRLMSSKITWPVGSPPPGATGLIFAVSSIALGVFFPLTTWPGEITIAVAAWLIDSVIGLDDVPRKLGAPLYVAVIALRTQRQAGDTEVGLA